MNALEVIFRCKIVDVDARQTLFNLTMNQQISIVKTVSDLRAETKPLRASGQRVGLIPTMGALHEGHLSLARRSVEQCDYSIATIFVNPTQFAPGEDLDRYPRTLEQDIEKLSEAGVDIVFVPDTAEIYCERVGNATTVAPSELALPLEGEFRTTHFSGVCTVVLKLFNIATPDVAYFGQKDFQQACVIKRMVTDLNVPIEIFICPIVRDEDGLALSSRNKYLDSKQRNIAMCLNTTLKRASAEIEAGQSDAHCLMAEMRQQLIDAGVTSVDYAAICDPETLGVVEWIRKPVVILLAVYVGETRLIDNCLIE